MDIEELEKEVAQNPVTPEMDLQEKDLGDDVNLDVTIEVENSSLKVVDNDTDPSVSQETNSENGKKKVKEEKPCSKIVVRRLPPTMTKDQFLEQVSPLPEIDYMYYVQGDVNNNVNPFSRAYLNFVSPDDLFSFSRTFDNYVFLDSKGQEYPAVVEFSMFQRVPKQRLKKKDVLMGTIGSDPLFITFKENVLAEALEISKSGGKTMKQHYFETEISTTEEVNTTPLLEFLKVRRAERARIKEERREEKKRKDLERKLKQKIKDKKGEGDEEDASPKEMKIQDKQYEKQEVETVARNKPLSEKEKLGNMQKDIKDCKENFSKKPQNYGQKISILKSDKFGKSNEYLTPDSGQNEERLCFDSGGKSSVSKTILDSKCDRFISSSPVAGSFVQDVEAIKIREAEQQTIYLRKLLGLHNETELSPNDNEVSDNNSSSSNGISSCVKHVYIPEQFSKMEPSEEVLSAFKEYINVTKKKDIIWSKHNINPALPSASFKTSNSSSCQTNSGDSSFEQRSQSAPRESSDKGDSSSGGLGRQAASSTPNMFIVENDSHKVYHVSRLLTKDNINPLADSASEVLPPKDRRDLRENRTNKKKEDKEKVKESRVREFKSRGGKSYQEERLKLAERREEQRKLLLNNSEKKIESGEQNDDTESVNGRNEPTKEGEKVTRIETRKFDNKRNGKYDNDDWKDDSKKRNRGEKKNVKRDGRERKDDYSRRHSEKRNNDSDNRRRTKNYKSSEFVKYDRKKNVELENKSDSLGKSIEQNSSLVNSKSKSWDDLTILSEGYGKTSTNDELLKDKKRSFSLDNSPVKPDCNSDLTRNDVTLQKKKDKPHYKDSKGTENSGYGRSRKEISNRRYLESKGNSKKKDRSDDKTEYAVTSKAVENDFKDKDNGKTKESSTRAERRIRNKDRPSIEIYRPGMGKFSKQRLEKEKALGSSTEIESPSHSPSPIPKSKLIS